MRFIQLILIGLFLAIVAAPAYAQRGLNTASARAAYSMDTPNWHYKKKNNKKKKNKKVKSKRSQKGRKNTDAAERRRSSINMRSAKEH